MMNIKNTILMVDPPEGWRYGFPCELPPDKSLDVLLVEHNYPSELMELEMEYSRYWEEVPGG